MCLGSGETAADVTFFRLPSGVAKFHDATTVCHTVKVANCSCERRQRASWTFKIAPFTSSCKFRQVFDKRVSFFSYHYVESYGALIALLLLLIYSVETDRDPAMGKTSKVSASPWYALLLDVNVGLRAT